MAGCLYIVGGFLVFCGVSIWVVDGYSSITLGIIITGAIPYLLRGCIVMHQSLQREGPIWWLKFARYVAFNPLIWLIAAIPMLDLQKESAFVLCCYMLLISIVVQIIFWAIMLCGKYFDKKQAVESEAVSTSKSFTRLGFDKHSETVSKLLNENIDLRQKCCELERDLENAHSQTIIFGKKQAAEYKMDKFAQLESENARLKKAYSDLQERHMHLIAARAVDRDAEAEIARLSEENARLKSDLATSRNAVDIFQRKLVDLQK